MLRNVISKPKAGTCREKAYKIINFLTFLCKYRQIEDKNKKIYC